MSEPMHIIDIAVEDEDPQFTVDEEVVRDRLLKILDALEVKKPVEFSVTFVDDDAIRKLNKQYRDKDEATDILSFVQADNKDDVAWPQEEEEANVLGDMVISLSSMRRNSERFGVSEDEELHRLLVHGVLHLLGWNHETNDVEQEPMLQKQEALLKRVRERSF